MGQPAARISDKVAHKKAIAGPIIEGCVTVSIGGLLAARKGDKVIHGKGFEIIVGGEPTVIIAGKQAARMGDKVACKGCIITGAMTVHIGKAKPVECLENASANNTPFVAPAASTAAARAGRLPPPTP